MLHLERIVVTPEEFDARFRDEALVAKVDSPEDESAYEKRDSFLIHLIKNQVERHFGRSVDDSVQVGEDWWPNHTRYVDLTPQAFQPAFLTSLHDLLSDEFANYRFQVCVYEDFSDGESYIGSVALYADRIVIEEKLHKLLTEIKADHDR